LFHRPSFVSLIGGILWGARPSELAVEIPMKFELVINLEAAKALVPRSEVSDQYDWRCVARQESGSNSPAGVFIISFPILWIRKFSWDSVAAAGLPKMMAPPVPIQHGQRGTFGNGRTALAGLRVGARAV
jgi:hypothetical protein